MKETATARTSWKWLKFGVPAGATLRPLDGNTVIIRDATDNPVAIKRLDQPLQMIGGCPAGHREVRPSEAICFANGAARLINSIGANQKGIRFFLPKNGGRHLCLLVVPKQPLPYAVME